MRNPNGYGSVIKLSGNRRRPYRVRKTIGWNEKGHPIYQSLGYTTTREEGMILLAEFNKDPWDIDKANITLAELYAMWWEKKVPKLGLAYTDHFKSAYKYCKSLHKLKYTNIKAYHMQEIIDNCGHGAGTHEAFCQLLFLLYGRFLFCNSRPQKANRTIRNAYITGVGTLGRNFSLYTHEF